jgi:hypothetical protein
LNTILFSRHRCGSAGTWVFSGRRWLDLTDHDDLVRLEQVGLEYHALHTQIISPYRSNFGREIASYESLAVGNKDRFMQTVDAVKVCKILFPPSLCAAHFALIS